MYRLKKGLLTLCTISGFFCSAQNFTTPEVFSFKQEVFRPISYYTGQANISIPLTQVQTNEITIPVTLDYVGGGGFRAINPYSSVGMGWRLSAGGAITRTKNGVCDETISSGGVPLSGFFSLAANTVTNNYVRNSVSSYVGTSANGGQYFIPQTEYSPDIFSFSFLGYSGYFLRGYDGQFKIQSQDIVSVEKLNAPWAWPGQGNCVGFTLTANDGTQFTFGSSEGSIELSGGNGGIPFQCDAWYLTQIKSTNGRLVDFRYQSNTYGTNFCYYSASSALSDNAFSPVVLDNITFNGGKVVFTSSVVNQKIGNVPSTPRMIDKVELFDADNQSVTSANFSRTSENLQRYYFLDGVTVNNKKYLFNYYNRNSLPSLSNSYGSDFWGYYNGKEENPENHSDSYLGDEYLNQNLMNTPAYLTRGPSEAHSKLGILTSITYPTGGVESYEYEANTYSYASVQTANGSSYQYVDESPKTGGLRIAQITLGNMVRKFRYAATYDPDHPDYISFASGYTSSGYLYKLPAVARYNGTQPLNFMSIDGEPHVVYSKVLELFADNSYTEYSMDAPNIKPDVDNSQNTSYYSVWANAPTIFNYVSKAAFVGSVGKNSSSSLERGQVSTIKVYDATHILKKSTIYKYASDINRYNENVAGVFMRTTAENSMAIFARQIGAQYFGPFSIAFQAFSVIHSYNIYTFPVHLDKVIETNYEGSSTIQQTTDYQYNGQKLNSSVITTNSTHDQIRTLYKYTSDINTGNYASMVTKKMLNFPVEEVQLKNSTITSSKLTTFKANGTSYVADKKFSLELTSPLTESGFTYFNGTIKDSRYGIVPEISYDSYDTHCNVTQTTAKSGIVTSYLWDASNRYPMAQVVGANYSQIGAQNGKPAGYSSGTLFSSLAGLVPSAIIKTYSYKSLVGMTSGTDARGRTIYYAYDELNRLKNIRDNEQNIIKKYEYAYADQNQLTAASLNAALDGFRQVEPGRMNSFINPSGIPRDQSIKDTRLFFRNGVAQLPEEYRSRDADFYSSLNLNLADPYYVAENDRPRFKFMDAGYSVEWRLKMPASRLNKDVISVGINFGFSAQFIIVNNGTTDGTYLYGYHDFDERFYGFANGGVDFNYHWVDTKDAFNNFQTIKLQVTSNSYRVYYNNLLVKEYPKTPNVKSYNQFYIDAAFLGNDGAVDYVKVRDNNGVIKYFEDFTDPVKPVKPAAADITPIPQNCQTAFINYFNQTFSTSYTSFSDIASLYLQKTGQPLNVCN
jgi:hypothetical protein